MAAQQLAQEVGGIRRACHHLGLPRATYYRFQNLKHRMRASIKSPLALTDLEKQNVLDLLHNEQFRDQTPYQIFATLLDTGQYYCSIRTMYRFLSQCGETTERRRGHQHRAYSKPELLATGSNQVWSWDITKLKGQTKWSYFHLYVILDIYSRYIVGWLVSERESSHLAKELIEASCLKQQILPHQLTIHADRGSSMKSKPVAFLLADLGVTKTHNRPHVSNDNPYSESQFKTLKYSPDFPERFYSLQEARKFCRTFFNFYNQYHRHSGIGLLTPHNVHYGHSANILNARQKVLDEAFSQHPIRFKNKPSRPKILELPDAVYINKPAPKSMTEELKILFD